MIASSLKSCCLDACTCLPLCVSCICCGVAVCYVVFVSRWLSWLCGVSVDVHIAMTDLRTGLLHFGFVGDKDRLDTLVTALEDLDFSVLEDLCCASRYVFFVSLDVAVAG